MKQIELIKRNALIYVHRNQKIKMEHQGYTIVPDHRNPYGKSEFMFYKTSEGIQHDGDYDDGWKYCGNCKWAATVEDAKAEIDDLIYETENK